MNIELTLLQANKGIGLEIVRQLTLQLPTSPFARSRNASDFLVYLTARNEQRGLDAVQALEGDQSLSKALKKHGGPVDVRYRQLDISDESSIKALAKWVETEHPEGIDVLVQNAGIATKGSRFDSEVVRETIKTCVAHPRSEVGCSPFVAITMALDWSLKRFFRISKRMVESFTCPVWPRHYAKCPTRSLLASAKLARWTRSALYWESSRCVVPSHTASLLIGSAGPRRQGRL